jgi:hypothetical protein
MEYPGAMFAGAVVTDMFEAYIDGNADGDLADPGDYLSIWNIDGTHSEDIESPFAGR